MSVAFDECCLDVDDGVAGIDDADAVDAADIDGGVGTDAGPEIDADIGTDAVAFVVASAVFPLPLILPSCFF